MPTRRCPRSCASTLFGADPHYFDNFDFTPFDYFVAGWETCPDTGRPHWQIMFQTKDQLTWNQALALMPGIHLDKMHGAAQDAAGYCKKGDTNVRPDIGWRHFMSRTPENPGNWTHPVEYGEIKLQGKRNDLIRISEEIMRGETTPEDVLLDNPHMYHLYGRTLNALEDVRNRKRFRTEMPECIWYYGPTGSGKSHVAFQDYDPQTMYLWVPDNGWWDDYNGQETVIFNEFRKDSIPFPELLQICDKWPYNVRRRCRKPVPLLATKIIFTCMLTPLELYGDIGEDMEQLYRRIKLVEVRRE